MDVRAFFPSRYVESYFPSLPFDWQGNWESRTAVFQQTVPARGSSTPALNSHRHSKLKLRHVIQSRSPAVTVRIVLPYGKRRDGMTGCVVV
jgi:hypothetical protein